jgi:hypothetical protein
MRKADAMLFLIELGFDRIKFKLLVMIMHIQCIYFKFNQTPGDRLQQKSPHPCEVWALPGLVDQGWHRHGCGTIFNSSLQPKAWAYLRKVVNDGG